MTGTPGPSPRFRHAEGASRPPTCGAVVWVWPERCEEWRAVGLSRGDACFCEIVAGLPSPETTGAWLKQPVANRRRCTLPAGVGTKGPTKGK